MTDNVLTLRSDAVRVLRHGPLEIDVDRLRVKAGDRLVPVGGLQLKLLLHLARHPDWVFTREQLLAELWGTEASDRDPKAVDVVICRLRRKLGAAGAVIESVRLFGYRLRSEKR